MNILIADDESVIREGVKRTIKKAFPDYEIHLAASAEDAVQLMDSQPIDIVLTDILMPGINGLEFMKMSRRKYPHAKWVVISAHSEFSYAQEAVRLGARDYLLKPIGKQRLVELMGQLADEARHDSEITREGELLKTSLKYLREAMFQRLASGLDIGNLDIGPLIDRYPQFHLIMVHIEEAVKNVQLEHFIIENVLSELIDLHGQGFVVSFDRQSLLGLAQFQDERMEEELLQELQKHLGHYLKVPFHIASSGVIRSFDRIPAEVRRLRQAPVSAGGDKPEGSGDKSIEVALQYLKAHYNEELSLEKVASVVFLNPIYFSQLFKQKTGHGYKEYVISLRIEQAKELLQQSGLRLAEIAERIGYADVRHFTQVFRRKMNVTPTEYRQQFLAER
ncbi:response regulator [Paenibacillus montanisoli]|uniref:DNA-binding response regulator n=1 Tax=Paenibacillus montanisoli TaxID=2081970 RepID=A0A328U4R7_9BACL|nr:response regulator [Paenibacillus montanisoli]RAP74876.1 DNA-binding response regulator [Paenibacillus montanisoli]